MATMKIAAGALGVVALLLGGLWLLQGLGLVHLRPILCFADCAAIQGRSVTWALIGTVFAIGGLGLIGYAARRRQSLEALRHGSPDIGTCALSRNSSDSAVDEAPGPP